MSIVANAPEDKEDNRNNKLAFFFGSIILLIIVLLAVYSALKENLYKTEIKREYGITHGSIVSYHDRSNSEGLTGRSITYQYEVNGKKYSRSVVTYISFSDCEDTITKKCSDRKFWVIFSKKDTSASLIDFLQNISSFPKRIDNFE
jgi:hypothetical protein